jgi:putative transposase
MVTPNQRREAVHHLVDVFGVSERQACTVAGQHRSTQRQCRKKRSDAELVARIRAIATTDPRDGYRRCHVILLRDGWEVNRKRVQRLWRHETLHVKRRTKGNGRSTGRVIAAFPDHVWSMDFVCDETADGRPIKILHVQDDFTRENVACWPARTLTAEGTLRILDDVRAECGCSPFFLRMDHGPEFIAQVTKDWCHDVGTNTADIDPGSPWQNGCCESFNDKLRDELRNLEIFDSMWEVRTMLHDRRHSSNHYRPHSSLSYLTPVEFAEQWRGENALLISQEVNR